MEFKEPRRIDYIIDWFRYYIREWGGGIFYLIWGALLTSIVMIIGACLLIGVETFFKTLWSIILEAKDEIVSWFA